MNQIGDETEVEGIMFSKSHVFVREDFFRFLDLEIKRARRYQNLFGILRFELCNSKPNGTGNQGESLKFLLKLLQDEIRETDVLGQTEKNEVMIILPYCDSAGSRIVHSRLDALVRDLRLADNAFKINSAFVCFPMEGTDIQDILHRLVARSSNGGLPESN